MSSKRNSPKWNGPERRRIYAALRKRDGDWCWICGSSIDPELLHGHAEGMTIDHYVPVSRGGTHARKNLRLAHRCCNELRANPRVAAA